VRVEITLILKLLTYFHSFNVQKNINMCLYCEYKNTGKMEPRTQNLVRKKTANLKKKTVHDIETKMHGGIREHTYGTYLWHIPREHI
jgi:hypothetical protein